MQTIKLNYLAKFRESLNCNEEILTFDVPLSNVDELILFLNARGDIWKNEFGGQKAFGVAVDHQFARKETLLPCNYTEIALFPPITGG